MTFIEMWLLMAALEIFAPSLVWMVGVFAAINLFVYLAEPFDSTSNTTQGDDNEVSEEV